MKNTTNTTNTTNTNSDVILLEQSNHYIYRGKIEDYNILQEKDNRKSDDFEHLDYNAFKKFKSHEKKTI